VVWKLLVQGQPRDGAAFERAYALSIYPQGAQRYIGGLRPAGSVNA
jgi:hypothetical protein